MDFGCNPNINNKKLLLRLDLRFENGTLVASRRIGWNESRITAEILQGDDDDLDLASHVVMKKNCQANY